MLKLKNLLAILVLISTVLFVGCQTEQSPVEPAQTIAGLNKLTIPAGATVTSATLNIWLTNANDKPVTVHRITGNWSETTVTWNSFGGAYAGAEPNTFTASLPQGFKTVDVTSLVISWLNGTYTNYGMLLDQGDDAYPISEYFNKETYPDRAAYLEICYTPAGGGSTVCDTTRVIEDTYIWETYPDSNFNAQVRLRAGRFDQGTLLEKQILLKFDIEQGQQEEQCETAYAYGDGQSLQTLCFLNIPNKQGNNWGWTNQIGPGTYNWPIYAGAGQCDISKGTLVGNLNVVYAAGTVTITYQLDPGFTLGDTHVWVGTGTNLLPKKPNGKWDSAPGQFNHNGVNPVVVSGLSGNIWIAAHAGVCWMVE